MLEFKMHQSLQIMFLAVTTIYYIRWHQLLHCFTSLYIFASAHHRVAACRLTSPFPECGWGNRNLPLQIEQKSMNATKLFFSNTRVMLGRMTGAVSVLSRSIKKCSLVQTMDGRTVLEQPLRTHCQLPRREIFS